MKYLLDTNICVFFFRDKFNIIPVLKQKGINNCCISEITLVELRYGAENSQNPSKHHELIDEFLKRIVVIPITDSIRVFAKEKVRLKKAGTPIHDDFDLFIGATAIQADLTLVTDNVKDFKRLANIKIENWIKR
ncbi:MAG: type II toxin-antitoxin system VapC family toxin [Candidatus Symbiothrix sp.]|jgi:tRNA(fMet)-specific endonuclease VapC|nr:type II toxin-antitoxin system VapC family toxin [Candidatus Symbiothrix sp.]